jgi:hypothetical protein
MRSIERGGMLFSRRAGLLIRLAAGAPRGTGKYNQKVPLLNQGTNQDANQGTN